MLCDRARSARTNAQNTPKSATPATREFTHTLTYAHPRLHPPRFVPRFVHTFRTHSAKSYKCARCCLVEISHMAYVTLGWIFDQLLPPTLLPPFVRRLLGQPPQVQQPARGTTPNVADACGQQCRCTSSSSIATVVVGGAGVGATAAGRLPSCRPLSSPVRWPPRRRLWPHRLPLQQLFANWIGRVVADVVRNCCVAFADFGVVAAVLVAYVGVKIAVTLNRRGYC